MNDTMNGSPDAEDRLVLHLYGRTYCHLCTDMEAALRALQSSFDFDVRIIDVDADPSLEARFGERVPVLTHGGVELCHYFLDEPAVRRHLSAACGVPPGDSAS
jgi:hypothetical protein